MAAKRRISEKGKRRLRLLAVLAVLVMGGVGFLVYTLLNPSSARMKTATISTDRQVNGVVIRDELTVSEGELYRVHFLVNEGDAVTVGQAIATVYLRGYEDKLADIVSAERNVYAQQLALLTSASADGASLPEQLNNLNNDVELTLDAMEAVNKGEYGGDYRVLEEQLLSLLASRRSLMATLVTPDSTLTNALSAFTSLETSFTQTYTSTLYNQQTAGYISFYLDGNEDALKVDSITPTQVSKVINSSSSTNYDSGRLYRIVTPNYWYFAFNIKGSSAERMVVGESYTASIVGEEGNAFNATVMSEKVTTDYITYVLRVDGDVSEVLSVRKLSFNLHQQESGVSVRLDGIAYVDGVPTMYILSGEDYVTVPVTILISDADTAIVVAQNASITLTAGLRYRIPKEG